MNIKAKKIINVTLIILLIILILLFLLVFFGKVSFSKFKKDITSNSIAEVAKPIFKIEGDRNIKIDGIEDTIYTFKVKNYENEKISDVKLNYYIEIVNNSDANLQFELTNSADETITLTNNKTGILELDKNQKESVEYKLKIKYNNNPAITNDIEGNVQIKVEAIQAEVI